MPASVCSRRRRRPRPDRPADRVSLGHFRAAPQRDATTADSGGHVTWSRRAPFVARTLGPSDPSWPSCINELGARAPARLRIAGGWPRLAGAVAIVGTRAADDDALDFARGCAATLAAAGRAVISGGAAGIDAAAHRGALEAGGATLAVLASGFDPPYPPRHADLFAEIAGSGALVSECEDGTPPHPGRFLDRNRLIAALAEVVLVVQAPARSGALSTAAVAFNLKKPVFTVPYAPWIARGEGCLALLRQGAWICTSARDVLSLPAHDAPTTVAKVAHPAGNPAENTDDFDNLDEHTRAVLRSLRKRAGHPDELSASLGLPILRVQQSLGQLVLLGLAVPRGDGRYARP